MSVNWVESFGLKGNPFSTAPLEDEFELTNLLVRTKSIRDQVLPIAKFIGISAPAIKIFLGARGSGKSTCLSCLRQLVQGNPNVLTVSITEIRLAERVVEDPTLGIGSPMVWFLIKDIIESLKAKFVTIYEENKVIIENITQSLAITDLHPGSYPVWSSCNIALESLLTILSDNQITLFIAIDNYDKLPEKFQSIAIDFLRGNNAQPFFEKLQRIGSTILIALGKEFYSRLSHPDFSYLGKPIEIRGLNPIEAMELLSRRLTWMLSSPDDSTGKIFSDSAVHRLTMHTNGIAREILTLAEQCMINASKRKLRTINEKIIKDTIQITEEVHEEYYEMIKAIKPVSMAKAADSGLKILSSFFATLPSTEFAINVIDCLLEIFNNPNTGFKASNTYLQSLKDAKIVSLVDSFPQEEWSIRMDVLNLLGHMHNKKSLRKFLDWLMEKEVQVKPPDFQITRMVKLGTELAYKYEILIESIENKKVKECLYKASKRMRELEAYSLEEELDRNTQIIGMVEIASEIGSALYYFNKLLKQDNRLSKKIIEKDPLLRFLKQSHPNLWFEMEFIIRIDELRHLEIQSKERIQDTTEKYLSFVENAYAILSQQCREIRKKKTEPEEIIFHDYFHLESIFDQLFSNRANHLIIEDQEKPDRLTLVFWKSLTESKQQIYGFATGELTNSEILEIKKRAFKGKNFLLFSDIESNLITFRPSILRDFYKKNYPLTIFNISDFTRFFNDLTEVISQKRVLISVMNKRNLSDTIFVNRDGHKYRLIHAPVIREKDTLNKDDIPKLIVIDGNNVARTGKETTGRATMENIISAIFKIKELGIDAVTFVTRSLLKDIDDRISLENSITTKLLQLPPTGSQDDDYYFLTYAMEKDGYVLTNDNLRDWKQYNPEIATEITKRSIKFFFVRDEIFFEGILNKIRTF